MKTSFIARMLLSLSLVLITPQVICAADTLNNNEVVFTGTILRFLENGDGGGTLFVVVNETELRVIVNPKTEIIRDTDEVPMSELVEGMSIRITGKFSSSGILASEILIGEPGTPADDTFEVCGHLTDVQASGDDLLLSLLGITVVADSATNIWQGGAEAPAVLLKTGLKVCIQGNVADSTWSASDVYVQSKEKKKDQVRFEGQVTQIVDADTIEVSVMGTTVESQVVHYDENTRIYGEIEVGVPVVVKGVLNSDLSVAAREIRVLEALEIKPDERKMKVGQAATFTVKLRETAVSGVDIGLAASGTGTVTGLPTTVAIPAGEKTGEFTVTAATMGEVTITATLGTHTATATIHIGEFSDEDTERPDKELYMAFAPSHIKMGMNDTRNVVLLIKPPQEELPTVVFTGDDLLLEITPGPTLSDGVAAYKVTINSKTVSEPPVATSVKVALEGNPPDGPVAELLVTIEDRK